MSDRRLYRVDYQDDEGNDYNFIVPEDVLSEAMEEVNPPIDVLLSSICVGELLPGYCVVEIEEEDDPGREDMPIKLVANGSK